MRDNYELFVNLVDKIDNKLAIVDSKLDGVVEHLATYSSQQEALRGDVAYINKVLVEGNGSPGLVSRVLVIEEELKKESSGRFHFMEWIKNSATSLFVGAAMIIWQIYDSVVLHAKLPHH